jgi:hypothetical protein
MTIVGTTIIIQDKERLEAAQMSFMTSLFGVTRKDKMVSEGIGRQLGSQYCRRN